MGTQSHRIFDGKQRLSVWKQQQKPLFGPRKKPLREWGHSRTVFLMHRDPSEALFWSQNSPVGWSSDSEARGTGFDSRLGRVMFGSLFGHVGKTFSSPLGLITEISARFRREIAQNCVAHLFGFAQN